MLPALPIGLNEQNNFFEVLEDLPFFYAYAVAGFPSPADDYPTRLDLNRQLIKNPDSTYMVRVWGDSMENVGIHSGDVLIVDRSITPADNKIVIVCLDGELFVKRIRKISEEIYLLPENEKYRPIKIMPNQDFEIWGVVIHVIHSL
jgi:DNA polymerase V